MIWDIRKKYQIEYFYETSALTGEKVKEVFLAIADMIYESKLS